MKSLLSALACTAALCSAAAAQAQTIRFDDPGLITIENDTQVATYAEAGYTLSAPAASFLLLDGALVAGFDDSSLSLKAAAGGSFSLLSLDAAFYDFGFGAPAGTLGVVGLRDGTAVVSTSFNLGTSTPALFGAEWSALGEVRFTGQGGYALDNISTVPEPAALALAAAGLLGLAGLARRRGPVQSSQAPMPSPSERSKAFACSPS